MELDARALALFRICLGAFIVSWACDLSSNFVFFGQYLFYPSESDLYRYLPETIVADALRLSLMVALPILGILFAIGWRSRCAAIGAWMAVLLIQSAAVHILQGADVLFRVVMFWAVLLPVSQTWPHHREQIDPVSFGNRVTCWAYTAQICMVYWFAALLKSDPLWTESGDALFYACNIDHFTSDFGRHMLSYPHFLRLLTFCARGLEFIGPVLILTPYPTLRLLAVILFMGFHLIGMQSLFMIGAYPWICAIAWIPFIPSFFWNWLERYVGVAKQKSLMSRTSEKKFQRAKSINVKHRFWTYAQALIAAVALLDIFLWNISSLDSASFHQMEQNDYLGKISGLEQRWNMYAPFPKSTHGWIIVPADLADGSRANILDGNAVSEEKPLSIPQYLGDYRWRRYFSELWEDRNQTQLKQYADFIIHRWNTQHPDRSVVDLSIIFMEQKTNSDLTVSVPVSRVIYFVTTQ